MSALRQLPIIAGQNHEAYKLMTMPAECEFAELIDPLPSVMTRNPLPEFSLAKEDYSDDLAEEFEPIDEPLADWLEVQADGYEAWHGKRSSWLSKRLRAAAKFARFRQINDVRELEKQMDFRF